MLSRGIKASSLPLKIQGTFCSDFVADCVGLGFGLVVGAEMLSVMLLGGVISRLISGLFADQFGSGLMQWMNGYATGPFVFGARESALCLNLK